MVAIFFISFISGDAMILELENKIEEISRLSAELESFIEKEGLPPKTGLNLNLVLEELITNTIMYGYENDQAHLIKVFIERDGDTLKVSLEDDGVAFNPLEKEPPEMSTELDDLTPGGLGIHLVKNLTDKLDYQRKDGKNILKMAINVA